MIIWNSHEPNQCTTGFTGIERQCRGLSLDSAWEAQGHKVQVHVMRDVVNTPHVAVVLAEARHAANHAAVQVQ